MPKVPRKRSTQAAIARLTVTLWVAGPQCPAQSALGLPFRVRTCALLVSEQVLGMDFRDDLQSLREGRRRRIWEMKVCP